MDELQNPQYQTPQNYGLDPRILADPDLLNHVLYGDVNGAQNLGMGYDTQDATGAYQSGNILGGADISSGIAPGAAMDTSRYSGLMARGDEARNRQMSLESERANMQAPQRKAPNLLQLGGGALLSLLAGRNGGQVAASYGEGLNQGLERNYANDVANFQHQDAVKAAQAQIAGQTASQMYSEADKERIFQATLQRLDYQAKHNDDMDLARDNSTMRGYADQWRKAATFQDAQLIRDQMKGLAALIAQKHPEEAKALAINIPTDQDIAAMMFPRARKAWDQYLKDNVNDRVGWNAKPEDLKAIEASRQAILNAYGMGNGSGMSDAEQKILQMPLTAQTYKEARLDEWKNDHKLKHIEADKRILQGDKRLAEDLRHHQEDEDIAWSNWATKDYGVRQSAQTAKDRLAVYQQSVNNGSAKLAFDEAWKQYQSDVKDYDESAKAVKAQFKDELTSLSKYSTALDGAILGSKSGSDDQKKYQEAKRDVQAKIGALRDKISQVEKSKPPLFAPPPSAMPTPSALPSVDQIMDEMGKYRTNDLSGKIGGGKQSQQSNGKAPAKKGRTWNFH